MATVQQRLFARQRDLQQVARDLDGEAFLQSRAQARAEPAQSAAAALSAGECDSIQGDPHASPQTGSKLHFAASELAPDSGKAQAAGASLHPPADAFQLSLESRQWLGLVPSKGDDDSMSNDASYSHKQASQGVVRTQLTRLHVFMTEPESSKPAFVWGVLMMLVILLSTISFVLSTVNTLKEDSGPVFDDIEMACVIVFTVDYVGRWMSCPYSRLRFMVQPLNVVDVISVLPWYIGLAVSSDGASTTSVFRVLRLLRVFRLFRLGARQGAITVVVDSMRGSLDVLLLVVFFLALELVLFATLMFILERGHWDDQLGYYVRPNEYIFLTDDAGNSVPQPSPFSSIPQGFWWGIVTVLTVGYGDVVPVTPGGKAVTMLAMGAGVIAMALPIGVLGTAFTTNWMEYKSKTLQQALAGTPCSVPPSQPMSDFITCLTSHATSLEDLAKLYGLVEKEVDELRGQLHGKLVAWRQASARTSMAISRGPSGAVHALPLPMAGKQASQLGDGLAPELFAIPTALDSTSVFGEAEALGQDGSAQKGRQSLLQTLSRKNSTQLLHDMVTELTAYSISAPRKSSLLQLDDLLDGNAEEGQAPGPSTGLASGQLNAPLAAGHSTGHASGQLNAPPAGLLALASATNSRAAAPLQLQPPGSAASSPRHSKASRLQQAASSSAPTTPRHQHTAVQGVGHEGPAQLPGLVTQAHDGHALQASTAAGNAAGRGEGAHGVPLGEGREEEEASQPGPLLARGPGKGAGAAQQQKDPPLAGMQHGRGDGLLEAPSGVELAGSAYAASPERHQSGQHPQQPGQHPQQHARHGGGVEADEQLVQRIQQLLGDTSSNRPADRELQAIFALHDQLTQAMAQLQNLLKVTGLLRGRDFPTQVKQLRLALSQLAAMQQETQDLQASLEDVGEDLAQVQAAAQDLEARLLQQEGPHDPSSPKASANLKPLLGNSLPASSRLRSMAAHPGSVSGALASAGGLVGALLGNSRQSRVAPAPVSGPPGAAGPGLASFAASGRASLGGAALLELASELAQGRQECTAATLAAVQRQTARGSALLIPPTGDIGLPIALVPAQQQAD